MHHHSDRRSHKSLKSLLAGALLLGMAAPLLLADTVSPVQSTARPLGLSTVGPVELAESDAASSSFFTNVLPQINDLLGTRLGETRGLANINALAVDPTKLRLATESTARVYFVGEGAGYHNTLGFNVLPSGVETPTSGLYSNAQLIFPDASSSVSYLATGHAPVRTGNEPLMAGDFVDLGKFSAGSTLDFFLISNGASGGTSVLTSPASRNPDHLNHVVSFALKDSPYLILAFEDIVGGGDKDYNDVIMAIDIGMVNVQRLISAPEPAAWLVLASFLGLVLWHNRRRQMAEAAV